MISALGRVPWGMFKLASGCPQVHSCEDLKQAFDTLVYTTHDFVIFNLISLPIYFLSNHEAIFHLHSRRGGGSNENIFFVPSFLSPKLGTHKINFNLCSYTMF